jgi:RNA polymerase sigma factor (sigma-70 family)
LVFDRHVDAVYSHCLRRCASWSEAEDLTSMAFLEAWRIRARVRFVEGSAKPWLLLVATNVARNEARARRRYEHAVSRLPRAESEPDIADEAIRDVDAEQAAQRLTTAMSKLRKSEQDVIALCDLGELSYAEAAGVLKIPVGTVRSRLSRARQRLQKLLSASAAHESSADQAIGADSYAAERGEAR